MTTEELVFEKWLWFEPAVVDTVEPVAGLYMVSDKWGKRVYVGESGNLANRLGAHVREHTPEGKCIAKHGGWAFSVILLPNSTEEHRRLCEMVFLAESATPCNATTS